MKMNETDVLTNGRKGFSSSQSFYARADFPLPSLNLEIKITFFHLLRFRVLMTQRVCFVFSVGLVEKHFIDGRFGTRLICF